MDRITSMTTFAAVVAVGSFAGAAQRLQMSPAMVTNHVRSLEERLGARLLNRTTRKISLTEAGRDYYERCTQILAQIEDADSRVSALTSAPRGTLRINASTVLCHGLATLIGDFGATYPEIHVELIATDRMVDPVEEGFDLAIRFNEAPDSSLIVRRLGQFRIVACAAPAYLEKRGTPRQPGDLAQHNCLAYMHPGFTKLTREWTLIGPEGEEVTVPISGSFHTNSLEAIRLAVVEGRGITMSQTYHLEEAARCGQLVHVLPDYHLGEFPIYAIYPHRAHMPVKLRSFIDFAARHFAEHPKWRLPELLPSRRLARRAG
ncbi:MAG TPA: LysR family transcriptional regulator [Stellaceae bacterium]|nr:LysR family transcriptional regulator [Stellaceae bacterium]